MLLEIIADEWGWLDFIPQKIIAINQFGNVIFQTQDQKYWRICPEELACELIATSDISYCQLWSDPEFILDWQMQALVDLAETKFSNLAKGRCYCLKMPAPLGGKYDLDNLGEISLNEVIAFSGSLAKQIKDFPDGTKIKLTIN